MINVINVPAFRDNYLLVVSESLIASIQSRLHPPPDPLPKVVQLYLEGLVLTPLFLRELEQFEQDDLVTLPVYLENMFGKIQKDKIEADGRTLLGWHRRRRGY